MNFNFFKLFFKQICVGICSRKDDVTGVAQGILLVEHALHVFKDKKIF